MSHQLTIVIYEKKYAICRLEPNEALPVWARGARFLSVTRTADELSIVCEEEAVPDGVHAVPEGHVLDVDLGTHAATFARPAIRSQ